MSPPLTAIRRQKNYHRGAEAQRKRLTCGAPRAAVFETLLPAVFVTQPYTLRLGHVMKHELLWDPCLDIVGQRTRNAFIRRGSGEREKEIALLRGLAAALGECDGVLLFPEGTRFAPAKRERALAHLADSGQSARLARAQRLQYVLPPRRGGALALLETRPDVDVAFLAHVGFEGTADLNDIWSGKLIGRTIRLCFRRVPSADIPRTAAGRIEWLDTQWEGVDTWVAAHSGSQLGKTRETARGDAKARTSGCAEGTVKT